VVLTNHSSCTTCPMGKTENPGGERSNREQQVCSSEADECRFSEKNCRHS